MKKRGPIPKGKCVLHRCDNPACINIDHLFLGTKAMNNWDMIAKGRANLLGGGNSIKGSLHPAAVLDEEQVMVIKSLLHSGSRGIDLASQFEVSPQLICDIRKERRWVHVGRGR